MRGRTTLIVAHRLSTISLADRVVLMEAGRVIADGTHESLLATEPRYARVLASTHRRLGEVRRMSVFGGGFGGFSSGGRPSMGVAGRKGNGLPFAGIPADLADGVAGWRPAWAS